MISKLELENGKLNQTLAQEKKTIDQYYMEMKEIKLQSDMKDKLQEMMKKQMDTLNQDLTRFQANAAKKEKTLNDKLVKRKQKLLQETKEKRNLEQRMKDNLQVVAAKNDEINSLKKTINDRDNTLRKERGMLDKTRTQRDLLEEKVPTIETSLSNLQSIVDKLNKELEKEQKKKELAYRDKELINDRLMQYKDLFTRLGVSANTEEPQQFKRHYEQICDELDQLSKTLAEKNKLIQLKDK